MANRYIKIGGKLISLKQLLVIYASSNELPDREDLYAARDRWGITKFVKPVRTSEGRKQVMEIQDTYQAGGRHVDMTDMPTLELDDVDQIRAESTAVSSPTPCARRSPKLRRSGSRPVISRRSEAWARSCAQRRRARGCTRAWRGHDRTTWSSRSTWRGTIPDHADSARKIIMEFANQFTARRTDARGAGADHDRTVRTPVRACEPRRDRTRRASGARLQGQARPARDWSARRRRRSRRASRRPRTCPNWRRSAPRSTAIRSGSTRHMLDEDDDDGDED
jgi:hypothetical protein